MKKVLFIDHSKNLGGAEGCMLLLIKYLDKKKYEPIIICVPGSQLAKKASELGIKVLTVEMFRLKGISNPLALLKKVYSVILNLKKIIIEEKIDIIHGNVVRASIYSAIISALTRKPFVWHVHDIHTNEKFVPLFLSVMSTKIVAITEEARSALPRFAQKKTEIVLNGIDIGEAVKSIQKNYNFRNDFDIPDEAVLVANVGWIAYWKGQDKFLEVTKEVLEKYPGAYFAVIGEIADKKYELWLNELKKQASNFKEHFVFTGYREDILSIMNQIDILAHCAKREPFGRVFLEAMACKKPIVAFNDGGAAQVVIQGETGYLVKPGDTKEMADAVIQLIEKPELRKSMGEKGFLRVNEKYGIEEQAKLLEKVYEEI